MTERIDLRTALISVEVASGEISREGISIVSDVHQSSETPQSHAIWPTAERLRKIAATQPNPRDVVRELRRKVRPASAKTLGMRLDSHN